MLVRGINHFVPHAFSPQYPDSDCPTHFNAGGKKTQFGAFTELMYYTNRTCHLFEGGTEIVSAAILYHAEAEWSGKAFMPVQKPARMLLDEQLNYDILPIDAIMEDAAIEDGMLCIGAMRYPVLLIPRAEYLPERFLCKLDALLQGGVKCAFVDGRPSGYAGAELISLAEAAAYVRKAGGDISISEKFELLRFRHVQQKNADVLMLVNESGVDCFDADILLPVSGEGFRVDLQMNHCEAMYVQNGTVHLHLERGQSTILVINGGNRREKPGKQKKYIEGAPIFSWKLSLRRFNEKEFSEQVPWLKLISVTGLEGDPCFSGTMRYETAFVSETIPDIMGLGNVGQTARVWINGIDMGYRYSLPYIYHVKDAVHGGENRLVVEIANTLVRELQDPFSHFLQIGPSGLLGPVKFRTEC